ncbi:DNA ligase D [Tistrella sp. BH-R2-4]|uniref:DNA ligase (ATP) n=1 Tax=Tistrella arctica TaxID=3133430 RepID=A0ABU9YLP4_9PROT
MASTPPPDDPLTRYRARRDFSRTPEPDAGPAKPATAPARRLTYAIQKHAARRLHYDLRLEWGGVLKSWAITRGPSLDPAQKRLAVRTEDHPLSYAGFEGRIPQGEYGGGDVLLWDRGGWEPLGDAGAGLEAGRLDFVIHGERLRGRFVLVKMAPRAGRKPEKRENWLLIKRDDADADPGRDITRTHQTSVKAGHEPPPPSAAPPDFVEPALATLVDRPPRGNGWVFEIKLDGYRALASISGDRVIIRTRSGLDWTARYPGIASALARRGAAKPLDRVLLDGEITALDRDGRPDFATLQAVLTDGAADALSFGVFDLLAEGGQSLLHLPLSSRKVRLRALLDADDPQGDGIHVIDHAPGPGAALLDAVCAGGHEGLIAKRIDAPYRPGRGRTWLKIKCGHTQEFIVIGWSPSTAMRPFASLLLGLQDRGRCRYAGRVGSGFTSRSMADLARRLAALERAHPPVDAGDIDPSIRRTAHWVDPDLVVQVAFAGFTGDGQARQARFLGLRDDKPAGEVGPETARPIDEALDMTDTAETTIAGIRLTHPDKVLFPEQGVTKGALARWLDAASDLMLPHLRNRLVSLVRCPDGHDKACFFQRHAGAGLPRSIARKAMAEKDGGTAAYLYLRDTAGVIGAAQMGVLEFHIWGSHVDRPDRPDRLVFDLDPDPAVDFPAVRQAAFDLRDALDALGLRSLPLLTGGKGIHVVAPIGRRHGWPVIAAAAKALAQRFADHDPARYVATMSKAKRRGRIFIDHFRNARSATAICPWSPRARPGAPVARPVTWADLPDIDRADAFRITDPLPGADPWAGYDGIRQSLSAAALRALGVDPRQPG